MGTRQWLSEGAEVLVRELQASAAQAHDCDVLIVGSGYGGAVAAWHLAGARERSGGRELQVFVLERGREYLPGMFPSRFGDLPGHVRFSGQDGAAPKGRAEGLFDVRLGETSVVVASGLGGGSLVNAAAMVRMRPHVLEQGWPAAVDAACMASAYATVERMLQVDDFPADTTLPKLLSLQALGSAMGAAPDDMPRATLAIRSTAGRTHAGVAREACLRCGDCVTGCNHSAKNSLDVNYLKAARDRGARLFCGATVHRLERRDDGVPGWKVQVFFTDRTKGYADADPLFTVRARRVVLAAGALGSTEILLRSKGPALALSERLGRSFSGNGDMIAVAWRQGMPAHCSAREDDAPATRGIGPTINGLVFRQADPDPDRPDAPRPQLLFQEFAIPGALRRVLGEVVATFGLLHDMPRRPDTSDHRADFRGDDPAAIGDDMLEHTAVYGVIGDDGAPMTVVLDPPDPALIADAQVRIDGSAGSRLADAQLRTLRRAQASDARLNATVVPNPLWEPLPGLPLQRTATVHPLGGCAMADHPENGVVDDCGRVFDGAGGVHDGLVVLDGAIVPRALGVNPALTIAALAERAMPRLMDAWALDPAPSMSPAPGSVQPAWSSSSPPPPKQPTAVALRERMTGTLHIGGVAFDASLTVAFAPIDDLQGWVRRLPRRVALPSAVLELVRPGGERATVWADGVALVLHRADSTAGQRSAAAARFLPDVPADPQRDAEARVRRTHCGEVRTIDYRLTVRRVDGDVALAAGDGLLLAKRLALADDHASPWRQLSEAAVSVESRTGTHEAGRLCLDPAYFVEQATPLLRVLSQQDQPNALGDVAALALFAARLVLKIRWPDLLAALERAAQVDDILPSAAGERMPGPFRYRHDTDLLAPQVDVHCVDPGTAALLTRYRPPGGRTGHRPVLLIHGLGASGSTFAHWSIGARALGTGEVRSDNLVAALLRARRDVWVLELRTSIALEERRHWALEAVAEGDIGAAMHTLLALRAGEGAPADERVDVVAHCVGAAMFCVATLGGAPCGPAHQVHERVGSVVLSQVGPLLRMGAMNRFRGYVASYVQQFLGAQAFDVRPPPTPAVWLLDTLLSTFPYPAGDRERERARDVPGFEVIRHRADAIWGRLMELDNVGDETLAALDAIYGWVVVRTLAQTIHFARHALVTDASGANRVVAHENFTSRFNFPVLLLHGQRNAMFDWQGAWDSLRVLKQAFADPDGVPEAEPPAQPPAHRGAGTPRQLRVIAGYGHQDCLIGRRAHADVFPAIVDFLDPFAEHAAATAPARAPSLVADLPWMGPTLGWVRVTGDDGLLRCRIALQPSPARHDTLALVVVPARLREGRWTFDVDQAAAGVVDGPHTLRDEAVELVVSLRHVPRHDGVAVLTIHDDIQVQRPPDLRLLARQATSLVVEPSREPSAEMLDAVRRTLDSAGAGVSLGVLRLERSWIDAADTGRPQPADALSFVVASCQYPAGLLDRVPAEQSRLRLAASLDAPAKPQWQLLLGDQVYVDETAGLFDPRPGGADDVARTYDRAFRADAFRSVARRLPTCFMLDDHEVADNWEPGRPGDPPLAPLAAYQQHQRKLAPPGPPGVPSCLALYPAGFPVFVLDARSQRQARGLRGGGTPLDDARIVPDATLAELQRWLQACPRHVPKFIASPSLVLPLERAAVDGAEAERLGLDSWSGFPASLVALLQIVARGGHPHVVFLSGDAHLSLVSSLDIAVPGRPPVTVHAVVSSGLHAPWPFANTRAEDLLLDGVVRFRHRGAVALEGTVETPVVGTAEGYARVDVRRVDGGEWLLAVALDLADGVTSCGRRLGPDGPLEPWRVERFRA